MTFHGLLGPGLGKMLHEKSLSFISEVPGRAKVDGSLITLLLWGAFTIKAGCIQGGWGVYVSPRLT